MFALAIAVTSALGLSPAVPVEASERTDEQRVGATSESVAATSIAAPTAAPTAAPAFSPERARPKLKRRGAIGMMIGGGIATAGFLWGSALVGANQLDQPDPARRSMGRVLPIPFVGPFLAASRERPGRARAPFVALGLEQLASAAVLTVGAVSLHRHRMADRAEGVQRRLDPKIGAGLIAGGVSAAMLTYGITLGVARERARQGDPFARRLQIPVVGGFVAAARAPTHVRGFGALTSSALQIGGLALTGVSAFLLSRNERASRRPVAVVPFGDAQSVHVSAAWRF